MDTPEAPKPIEQAKPTGSADIDALKRINAAQAQTIRVLMDQIAELKEEAKEEPEEEQTKWHFEFKRNEEGYIEDVIATPLSS